jgi:putative DNA primase/helicase
MAAPNVIPIKQPPDAGVIVVLKSYEEMGLKLDAKRQPIGCLENVVKVLTHDPAWAGVLAFNDFTQALEKKALPPYEQPSAGWWTDGDDARLELWLSENHDLQAKGDTCRKAVGIIGDRNAYHPVREYLEGLTWDNTPRLYSWLIDYLGAQTPGDLRDVEYYRKSGRWWLISAVARIFAPGCKADHVLLLEGEQGTGKSTALSILFGDYFSDTPLRIGNKDSYVALNGVWGYELAELDSLNRAETSASKAFFTSSRDKYRPPFGHRDAIFLRQVVFAGTVNHDCYLRDSTGNRRYWPVRCGSMRLRGDDSLEAVRDQLFAEAVVAYRAGELWYPNSLDDHAMFAEQQRQRELGDVYEALIEEGTAGRSEISMASIFKDILDTEPSKMTRAEQMRVGEAMRRLGWEKKRMVTSGQRSYLYVKTEQAIAAEEERSGVVPF